MSLTHPSEFDQRLYKGGYHRQHRSCENAGQTGYTSPQEESSDLIVKTLKEILADIEAGKVEFTIESEDIHMNIETILTERIGDTGKKLHTARSRNDQIAVDIRLYLKKKSQKLIDNVLEPASRRSCKSLQKNTPIQ